MLSQQTYAMFVGALSLTTIETVASAFIGAWNRRGDVWFLVAGCACFALLGGAFAGCVRWLDQVYLVNALWQAISIPVVTVASCILLGERILPMHAVGIGLATLASLCFLLDRKAQESS